MAWVGGVISENSCGTSPGLRKLEPLEESVLSGLRALPAAASRARIAVRAAGLERRHQGRPPAAGQSS